MIEKGTAPKKKSFFGVLSIVFAVLGIWLLFVVSFFHPAKNIALISLLIAVILGLVYLAQVIRGNIVGIGVAQTVIIFVLLCAVIFTMTPLAYDFACEKSREWYMICPSNLKMLSMAMRQYFQDYNAYPPESKWNEATYPYVKAKEIYICPEAQDQTIPSYAVNSYTKNWKRVYDDSHTIMFFDSISGKNMSGGKELFPNPSRHSGGANFSFMDGHVKWMKPEKTVGMWMPVGKKK